MAEAMRLADAVWDGDLTAVEALLAAGADVNGAGADDQPPLLWLAVEQYWPEIVRRLIAAGAKVNRYPGLVVLRATMECALGRAIRPG